MLSPSESLREGARSEGWSLFDISRGNYTWAREEGGGSSKTGLAEESMALPMPPDNQGEEAVVSLIVDSGENEVRPFGRKKARRKGSLRASRALYLLLTPTAERRMVLLLL